MIQEYINKYFYYLFIVILFFGVICYDLIGFHSIDELCGGILFIMFIYYMFQTKEWMINKYFLFTLGVFFFYLAYSLWIRSNTPAAILNDFIIQFKPYLAFFCAYQLMPSFNKGRRKLLQDVCLVTWVLLVPLGLSAMVNDRMLWIVMGHPSNFAASIASLALVYLFCGNYTKKERIIFIAMLSVGLISGRAKFYGFFALSAFAVLYFSNAQKLKLDAKTIIALLLLVVVILFVAREKIQLYFVQGVMDDTENDYIARFVLYATALLIFRDYLPFGSGFASFATHSSGEWYSKIYQEYEIDGVWGISKSYHKFIADTYYPSLAQFGIAGVLLFAAFWIYILSLAVRSFKRTNNPKLITIIILVIGFMLIENVADATFTSNRGLFMMMFLGLLCAAQYSKEEMIQENTLPEVITDQNQEICKQ